MEVNADKQTPSAAERLGRRAAKHQDEVLARVLRPSVDERVRAIRRGVAVQARRDATRRVQWRAGMLLAACFAIVALYFVFRTPAPLTYQIAGKPGHVGEWVTADGTAILLEFSDGSHVSILPGSAGRVTSLDAEGAHLSLERGTMHVQVVPRRSNAWAIVAGPFAVNVVGTEFDVTWDASSSGLAVAMTSGHVRIESTCSGVSARDVTAPSRVEITCVDAPEASRRGGDASTQVAVPADGGTSGTSSSAPTSSASVDGSAAPSATAAPGTSGAAGRAGKPAWRQALEDGRLKDALTQAEASGLDEVMRIATGSELVELASAARLRGEAALAGRIYRAVRDRFSGSDAAANAAYHLGRMAFDSQGAWAEAERWFGVYLGERPGGALAPEALGRSLECAQKQGNAARAREIAERYLDAYPEGAHAAVARALVDGTN